VRLNFSRFSVIISGFAIVFHKIIKKAENSFVQKKSDLTLIEINVICEVPFYFVNIILIDKII